MFKRTRRRKKEYIREMGHGRIGRKGAKYYFFPDFNGRISMDT